MNLKYIISTLLIVGSLATKAQNPVTIDEIIVKVDNYIILKSELERAYLDAVANGATQPDLKCLILGSMVRDKLMVAHAEIDSVVVTDEEVSMNLDRRIQLILNQYNGSEEMILQYYGKTLEDIRTELKEQVREQLVVDRMQGFITEGITVTPTETKRFYRKIPSDSLPYYDMDVEVAQITKTVEAGNVEKQKVIDELIELRKRVVKGESFEDLARRYSQGPSAPQGGNLGTVKRGSMVPEFEAVALSMKAGEISMPVETEFGFHLIKLEDRRGNEYASRHILIRPVPSAKDVESTAKYMDSLRNLIALDSVDFEFLAREYSDDEMTSGSGGFYTDQTGSLKMSVRELAPDVYFALDSMEVGTLSPPLEYQMQDGNTAVRLLWYKSRKDPHQANLDDDWQRIQSAALMEKKNKKLVEWFNEAQDDVFISIDEAYEQCQIIN